LRKRSSINGISSSSPLSGIVSVASLPSCFAKGKSILAMSQIGNYSQKDDNEITENENKIDMYEDVLGTYLVKLSSKSLTIKDSKIFL